MDLLLLLVAIGASIFLVLWRREVRLRRRLTDLWLEASQIAEQFPIGARISYEVYTGRDCRRCGVGRIIRRKRFKSFSNEGRTVVREVTGTYKCDNCSFRGLSRKQFS